MTRRSAALLTVAVLAGACSDAPAPETPQSVSEGASAATGDGPGDRRQGKQERSGGRDKATKSGARPNRGPGDGAGTRDAGDGGGGAGGARGGRPRGPNEAGGEEDRAAASYPAAGGYRYEQSGFEEYCQTGSCEREELPPMQSVELSYRRRSSQRATIVSDARISEQRSARTTFRFTKRAALVTEVVVRYSRNGFSFENSYRPDPPVESLRFPLRVGKSWSGRWKAQTSGDYRFEVVDRARVLAGGRSVEAFRLDSVTRFRGEFDGRAAATYLVDPDTRAVVGSQGHMKVSSTFGDFETTFKTRLRSGPGY